MRAIWERRKNYVTSSFKKIKYKRIIAASRKPFSVWNRIFCKQESPPAWTQEAYRPPCSEYSFCCPTWVPPQQGTPPSWPGRGGTWPGYPPARVPPLWPGYPLAGYPPGQGTPRQGTPQPGSPQQGTPLAGPGRVPPQLDLTRVPPPWPGYPPSWTWQGTPPAAPWHSGKCCKALWDMGTPPVNKLTKWNYYLPVVLRTRAVIIKSVSKFY